MNKDKLKNIFLGIIAINLTLITLIQLEVFPPKAYASETTPTATPVNTNYGLVPLNEDGSIDVNVVSSMDVWIKGWISMSEGRQYLELSHGSNYGPIPVEQRDR